MPSLIHKVRALATDGADPSDAVATALRGAKPQELRDAVKPLLMIEAEQAQRAKVRELERNAFPQPSEATPALDLQRESLRILMEESFAVDGRHVSWSSATAEDHRLRAQWLRKFAASTLNTAARHEQAAEQIESAGVSCLAELTVPA